MTKIEQQISEQYQHGNLIAAIEQGLQALGSSIETTSVEELAPVDEFHIGGRGASVHLFDQLEIAPNAKLLDLGCGLGGGARFVAQNFEASVTGIDLNQEYVHTGKTINQWVGLQDRVDLRFGNAGALPFDDNTFDGAYMMHVGMNIADKPSMFSEVMRVLKPDAKFAIYDIMKTNAEALTFPVPWADTLATSWVCSAPEYRAALSGAGFEVLIENDRRDFALDFFKKVQAATAGRSGPPPLGLHVLMQRSTAQKIPNMISNLMAGRIAPFEIISRKAG